MKRAALLRHLRASRCVLLREGGRHSVFYNPLHGRTSTVPRHAHINDFLAEKICKDSGIATFKGVDKKKKH